MLEFDMTAFVARNATESIGFIKTEADAPLTDWLVQLGKEYISIPTDVYELGAYVGPRPFPSFPRFCSPVP